MEHIDDDDPYHYWRGGTKSYLDQKVHVPVPKYVNTVQTKEKGLHSPMLWRKCSVSQFEKSQDYHKEAILTEDTGLTSTAHYSNGK